MPRPIQTRTIGYVPKAQFFKPGGIPASSLAEVSLSLDELEAIRLADLHGLYQEDAAPKMNISRSAFARILGSARKKIADALIHEKMLRLEGGVVHAASAPDAGICPGDCPCQRRHQQRGQKRGGVRGGARRRNPACAPDPMPPPQPPPANPTPPIPPPLA